MGRYDDVIIRVHSNWDAWQTGAVRVGDLEEVHWFQPARAPRVMLHGYVSCDCLVGGGCLHECDRTSAPHRLRVCVVKRHATAPVYAELVRRAAAERLSCRQALLPDRSAP